MDTQEIPTPTDTEARREIALRAARSTARLMGSVEKARARVVKTLADYPTLPASTRASLEDVRDALDGAYGPIFPEGTPEYARYVADLRTELAKFAAREAPYN